MSSQDTAGHQTIAQLLQQGLFHHRQGDIPTAMERYAEVLGKDPKNAEALYYVAVIACQENQFKQGVDLVRRAMSYSEPQARMFNVLGQALDRLGEPLEAIKALDEAIKLDPNLAAAHGNRANILVDAGMPGEALKSFNRALELIPDSIPDLLNRGALLAPAGRYEDALRDYDKVIALEPSNPEVHSNRANVLKDLGLFELGQGAADSPRFDEALASYNRAIKIQPGLHEAYLGRAMLQLARGDFAGGFADYEHRSEVGRPGFTPLAQPRWDGAPLNGERLVLLAEQGLGDTIQFCRFAPVLAAQGVEVTLLVKKAMAPLMRTVKGITVTGDISEVEADTRPFRWLPLMSAPHLLGTTLESLPHEIPYLSAEPARVKDWAGKLGDGKFKIGINWNPGNPDHTVTSRRDIPLAAFAELAALPGVELISLQKGTAGGTDRGCTLWRPDPANRRRNARGGRSRSRHRRGDTKSRPGHRLRHLGGASRRRAGAAGIHRRAADFRLALDAQTRRHALVSVDAVVPPERQPRLGAGSGPDGGHRASDDGGLKRRPRPNGTFVPTCGLFREGT